MSAFLSHVHEQLYDKIKYQEVVSTILLSILQKEKKEVASIEENNLPKGDLSDIIDLEQIHGWLHSHLKMVESRFSYLLNEVKHENLLPLAKVAFFEEGQKQSKDLVITNPIEAFQQMQLYILDGMPCDRGIVISLKEENRLAFQIDYAVHDSIEDKDLYMELRLIWIQGFLQEKGFKVQLENPNQITITKESVNV